MMSHWRPREELMNWSRELDGFFGRTTRTPKLTPAVDIVELKEAYLITADLPGINKDDLEIQVENATLTLSGKRVRSSSSEEEEQNCCHRRERSFGSFSRSFRLGPEIAADDIAATFDNGVLTLRLPKAEESKPHRIDVH